MTELPELPHNFEAEQALLGAILMNNAAYHQVADFLRAEHFADPLHRELFEALAKLLSRGQIVNAISLKTFAEQNEALRLAGGAKYLAGLLASSVHVLDAASMGRVVTDAATRRRIIHRSPGLFRPSSLRRTGGALHTSASVPSRCPLTPRWRAAWASRRIRRLGPNLAMTVSSLQWP
jgi:DnaB-like helicase N terminal domain